ERGAGGGRRLALDPAGALLPAGPARPDRRLRDARARRVDPPHRLPQLPGAGRPRARTGDRGGLGRDVRALLPGRYQRARTRPLGAAARPVRSVRAPAPERRGRQHPEPPVAGPHDFHRRGARRRVAGQGAGRTFRGPGRHLRHPLLIRRAAGRLSYTRCFTPSRIVTWIRAPGWKRWSASIPPAATRTWA